MAACSPCGPPWGRCAAGCSCEVKYRELRDLELDYRTGKLSSEDYEATGATLRAEAIAILDRIEQLDEE